MKNRSHGILQNGGDLQKGSKPESEVEGNKPQTARREVGLLASPGNDLKNGKGDWTHGSWNEKSKFRRKEKGGGFGGGS